MLWMISRAYEDTGTIKLVSINTGSEKYRHFTIANMSTTLDPDVFLFEENLHVSWSEANLCRYICSFIPMNEQM